MSYQLEVECIAAAHDLDLLTSPYVFNLDDARRMTEAGADLIVAHMGLTSSGTIGARTTKSLENCVGDVQAIVDTCKAIHPEVLVLCHGGPIATPAEAQYMINSCRGLDGFYGASSMERLPTERAITAEIQKFAALSLRANDRAGEPVKKPAANVSAKSQKTESRPSYAKRK
jgi:predicted TIM-barrel enzyme